MVPPTPPAPPPRPPRASPRTPPRTAARKGQKPRFFAICLPVFSRQRDLYRQLEALSQRQGQLVADSDAEALLGLLGQRQRLLDELDGLNVQLQPYRADWREHLAGMATDERAQVAGLVDEIAALRDAIVAQDDRDFQRLRLAQGKVGAELGKTANQGRAMNSYRGAATAYSRQGNPSLADHRG